MSKDKTARRRKAGAAVSRGSEPRLRLLKPQSECATTGLIAELSREAEAMLRGQKRRRKAAADEDPPEAA